MDYQSKTLTEHWIKARQVVQEAKDRGTPEFPTGLKFLDDLTGGLKRGQIWIISGKTASGKTSLAMQMARSFADNPDNSILVLSLEMQGWELALRMYCEMNGQDYSQIVTGNIDIDPNFENSFKNYIANIDFEIIERGYHFEEVENIIKTHYKTKKPDVIFLDFIQLIEWKKFKEERIALMEYIRKIKEMANEMNIAFVIVSQIRRLPSGADYNRAPDLFDLKGSGSLEQCADKVILIYKTLSDDGQKFYLNLAKNRQGQTIEQEVKFIGQYYRFEDIVEPKPNPVLFGYKD